VNGTHLLALHRPRKRPRQQQRRLLKVVMLVRYRLFQNFLPRHSKRKMQGTMKMAEMIQGPEVKSIRRGKRKRKQIKTRNLPRRLQPLPPKRKEDSVH
jgi:hypothetical protein